jgi:probable LLM family oxidoreductase
MEIGIDSFAAANPNKSSYQSIAELLERIEFADKVGLDVFGIGEHHRIDFLDSAPDIIMAAAASRTQNIKLTNAVRILSAIDPVRAFQSLATLDLVSNGRAEMVAGRASFIDAFPLFGLNLNDYDALFVENLNLFLQIRDNEVVNWSGKFRPALKNQAIYPRPIQEKIPVWLGVGGTPESFARAGSMGLPLMVAVIGGETHRFRPLIDLYRKSGEKAGFTPDQLKVGLHSLGYVAETTEKAKEEYYPGYAEMFTKIGKERGWPPVTRPHFESQAGYLGAFLVGSAEEVADKILRHSQALGGISRLTFQMDNAGLSHTQLLNAIELIGTKVSPIVNKASV